MDAEYRKLYRELFEKHWWWRARSEWITETLRRLRPAQGWPTILDVGCGEGLFFERLAEFGEVEGVEVAEQLPPDGGAWRGRIHVGPFDESFQPGKQYSLILMLDVLEHLQDPAAALRKVRGLLEPDGLFLATVPAFMSLWTQHDVINQHFARYSKRTLRPLAYAANLQIVEDSYFFQWPSPLKLMMHGLERVANMKVKMASVPPPWINEPLYWLARAEQATLGRLPVPFGTSLMMVAR